MYARQNGKCETNTQMNTKHGLYGVWSINDLFFRNFSYVLLLAVSN